jgi:hypothetical protein
LCGSCSVTLAQDVKHRADSLADLIYSNTIKGADKVDAFIELARLKKQPIMLKLKLLQGKQSMNP